MLVKCYVKHLAKTQTTTSLSSGEAELHGIAYGAAQAMEIRSLCKDMGWNVGIMLHSDATAAIGIARRKGLGKIRHLDCTDLWIQRKIWSKALQKFSVQRTWRTSSRSMWIAKPLNQHCSQWALPAWREDQLAHRKQWELERTNNRLERVVFRYAPPDILLTMIHRAL